MFHQPRQTSEEVGDIFQQGNIGISAGVIGDNLWLELLHLLQQVNQVNHRRAQIMERLADVRDIHPITAAANAR